MAKFNTGDNVLVTLGGIDVPAVVSTCWSDAVDFIVSDSDSIITVLLGAVRLDLSKRTWAVGDAVETASELTTLPDNAVFVDVNYFVQEWDDGDVWRFGDDGEFSPTQVDYPVTIVYVPKER